MDRKKDTIMDVAREFKRVINQYIKIDRCILFGSQAKGTAKPFSDVDLLFVSSEFAGKKYFERSPQFYLMWNYPYDVDIICLTPRELQTKKRQIGIIKEAVETGIEI